VKVFLAVVLLVFAGSAMAASIQLVDGTFQVSGLTSTTEPPSGWSVLFPVYAGSDGVPPMSGTYSLSGTTLSFKPRYPLSTGVRYRAVYSAPGIAPLEVSFDGPRPSAGPAARLERIYPSANVLPSNQLKLYLVFSRPMSRGGIWSHIHLIGSDGKPVQLPFLEIDQELWDRDNVRLTALFDPGRIKRGVGPEQEMGVVLEEGKRYTLVVDREMVDARSLPMAEAFRREITVGPAVRDGIDLKKWKLTLPAAGTMGPLVIDFDRPLDYALVQHVFQIPGISGSGAISREETRWTFQPTRPWRAGRYDLVIDMSLEDLAGNRIGRPFDVDLFDRVTERITTETTSLPFEVH